MQDVGSGINYIPRGCRAPKLIEKEKCKNAADHIIAIWYIMESNPVACIRMGWGTLIGLHPGAGGITALHCLSRTRGSTEEASADRGQAPN